MAERISLTESGNSEPIAVARLLYPSKFIDLLYDYFDSLLGLEISAWDSLEEKKTAIIEMRKDFVRDNVEQFSVAPDKTIFCLVQYNPEHDKEFAHEISSFQLPQLRKVPENDATATLDNIVQSRGSTLIAYSLQDIWDASTRNIEGFDEQQQQANERAMNALAATALSWQSPEQ